MEKIKMVQYGCGKMSKYTMRYAIEKGVEIVGAFDINPNLIGKDISTIIGQKEKLNVKVQDAKEFEKFAQENDVDVAIVTTTSLFSENYPIYEICAINGINVISTCEEAFYAQNSSPVLANRLDQIAKLSGCTICGSGYQDVFWGNLITTLAGATHTIKTIRGKSSYNVEDYGISLAKVHGAGLSPEDFEKEIASADNISEEERQKIINDGNFAPSYMWNVNGWLASKLGLTITHQTQKTVPQIATEEIYSSTLDMTIPKGYCTGMSAVVTTETEEGITIISECIGKVYNKDEFDCNDWTIEGEPNTRVVIERPATVELTCASVINRIPEVILADPGYTTTDQMPTNNFKKDFNDFVDYMTYLEEHECEHDCCCDDDCDCGCHDGCDCDCED
jgi:4-hydroxy-tetrahydrodipicolinate reductase